MHTRFRAAHESGGKPILEQGSLTQNWLRTPSVTQYLHQ
jgi:hypothetical protein